MTAMHRYVTVQVLILVTITLSGFRSFFRKYILY